MGLTEKMAACFREAVPVIISDLGCSERVPKLGNVVLEDKTFLLLSARFFGELLIKSVRLKLAKHELLIIVHTLALEFVHCRFDITAGFHFCPNVRYQRGQAQFLVKWQTLLLIASIRRERFQCDVCSRQAALGQLIMRSSLDCVWAKCMLQWCEAFAYVGVHVVYWLACDSPRFWSVAGYQNLLV